MKQKIVRILGLFSVLPSIILLSFRVVAQQPALIDRELLFGDPEISVAKISPDGQYIAFLKPFNKTRNIWVKKREDPFSAAKPITGETTRPISSYFWSRDSKYILFVQDRAGDEKDNVYAVNPAEPPAAGSELPSVRNLTAVKGVTAVIYAVPRSDPDLIYIGLNDRDKAWHDLYKVRISTGERFLVHKNRDRISNWVFDNNDLLRLAVRSAENGDSEVLSIGPEGFNRIYACDVLETCNPIRFYRDNQLFYMETNKGNVNFSQLVLFDLNTGKEELVESDPLKRVDFDSAVFSDLTNELVGTIYVDDRQRIYWKNQVFEADYNWLQDQLQGKQIKIDSMTRNEQLWIVTATADNEPGESYLFNRPEKKLILQYRLLQNLDREQLAATQTICYRSSDGLEIPAYLTLPKGLSARNLPTVVFPHGGPWLRNSWGFNPFWQFLANRGYAVLSPNFRGSTGYGKEFLNAGNKQWGEKMQDDLTWGVKYLVAQGITDPKRVGIMGGSYGGYATLAGVAFTPEIYAAAVSSVGPSNLITFAESLPPYWEGFLKTFYVRVGDPTKPEGKAQLRRQSPINSAFRIKTPLLIVHGANDPRVKRAESDQIVIALRDRGLPVEYLLAPDEGHGFTRPVNRMAMIASSEKFLAKYLGGRFQESMPSEVATRLKEITVDPKTVVDPSSVLSSKGIESLDSGNIDEAISLFGKAIEINPKYSKAYVNRGNAYIRKKQYDHAISDYDKALEINPKSAEAYYHRGIAHYLRKEYDKSWEDINKAQDLGYKVPTEFLEELRKASGRQK